MPLQCRRSPLYGGSETGLRKFFDIIAVMNQYCRLIPRLNGSEIEQRSSYYLGLVKKGVAGFIVFGGELETVREGLKKLRRAAKRPLLVMSDLEQGLGQQIKGGTIFPPAMAVASAIGKTDKRSGLSILKKLYTAFADEAKYAGINTILAPVLDINTDHENPIIATRSFGEDPETVSFIGCEMIRALQANGVAACAKHFPGHGDTKTDSHISLPVIGKSLSLLEGRELVPFDTAIRNGVRMVMFGHLSVPSLDSSGSSISLSEKAVSYIRKRMGFKGTLITDALNMGGLEGYSEEDAALMSISAGINLILHPTNPDKVAAYLLQRGSVAGPPDMECETAENIIYPDFKAHGKLSGEITAMSLKVEWDVGIRIKKPFMVLLSDDKAADCTPFADEMKRHLAGLRHCEVLPDSDIPLHAVEPDSDVIVAVFSEVKAWKKGAGKWLLEILEKLKNRTRVIVSFGNPYVLRGLSLPGRTGKIYAYWSSETAHKAVAERLTDLLRQQS